MTSSLDWDALDRQKYADEDQAIAHLAGLATLSEEERDAIHKQAVELVQLARKTRKRKGMMESFLQEFGLSNKEGLALMCLAEALLRVPDSETVDALIAEKVGSGDWAGHLGQSDSLLVNASTWGLMLTGKLIEGGRQLERDPAAYIRRLASRMGEPAIRSAMMQAMRIMGEQFVLGRTIKGALKRGAKWGSKEHKAIFSFDMLGEGARTRSDAERYFQRYSQAIEDVGQARGPGSVQEVSGVSVKLSALHPRYESVKRDRVMEELYPQVLKLAQQAKAHDIGFCLDAEEADRLVISLQLLEKLCFAPELEGWQGLGLAVQAYQKRAMGVITNLQQLGRASGRRLMVRLVKGAYWDTEIKHAQQEGMPDFPVWTTKQASDLNYLACARTMISDPDTIYGQFATHNAHTLAAVHAMALDSAVEVEFQRLHGMGDALYGAADKAFGPTRCRIYAPVGSHDDLLPYLVRRLLENGANTSFVHSFLDERVPAEKVAGDPYRGSDTLSRNPHIPASPHMYGPERPNSAGLDLTVKSDRNRLDRLIRQMDDSLPRTSGAIVNGDLRTKGGAPRLSPVDHEVQVSLHRDAEVADIDEAFDAACAAFARWDQLGGPARGVLLRACADALEANMGEFIGLMAREAGKTLDDGIAEVREAVDFCRYYAADAEQKFAVPERLPGPAGESNHYSMSGRGVFVAVSPWNFPLAIFTGQIMAALAAGNCVLAKPAEQTPMVAYEAVRLFHKAGIPTDVLHLLPGSGEKVGAKLVSDPRHAGVVFTGGTDTARIIQRSLADRPGPIVPLIAETGGLNAMVVDTSALREQVIDDVVISAFGSAGQRCSALRILMLPASTADRMIEGLKGAMHELRIGDPARPDTDVGPVIDEEARAALQTHLQREDIAKGLKWQMNGPNAGTFFGPAIVEIDDLANMNKEVFGPVLHVLRYKPGQLDSLLGELHGKGYGLTLGVHSRIAAFADNVRTLCPAGNVYVNRSMTGAVVGVQPFGGHGLSGTGPKAGGPNYLNAFATETVITVNIAAQGGDPELLNLA